MTTKLKREDMGFWSLPLPPDPSDKYAAEWEAIPFVGNTRFVPFGYMVDPADSKWLLPIPKELQLFELAKDYLKRYS